ncbi:MAG: hypothetical protein ACM3JJ_03695 [Hyphomicrobiales bacterium]
MRRAGRRRRAAIASAVAAGVIAMSLPPPGARGAPVGTVTPGGEGAAPDSIVLVYPVGKAPSLLALSAIAPLAALRQQAASSPTLLRREGLDPARAATGAAGGDPPSDDAIVVSGTKSLSVEMGRGRDASLAQALDLTLRGRMAGDVEIAATLSDQRLPFQPDGSTRELQDLDRVSLSVRAPQGEATMGDFRLEGLPGTFARVTRALEGVRGEAHVRGTSWDVAAASAKGERRSLEFRGEDGKQGPYDLTPSGVSAEAAGVVAGTETVWIDGVKLRRGADADYVMDYGAGTITFTVRRVITAQSRIAVDFEAATTSYRRNLYAASTRGAMRAGGGWYATYLREGDDAKSPLGASLTPEDRHALGQAGDATDAPLPSGIRNVGAGNGSYAWDASDPSRAHWVWLGPGRGDYEVDFASAGAGRGAYADTLAADGTRFYRYVGPSLGDYVPGRTLTPPTQRVLLDVGGTTRIFGALGVEAEVAHSSFDKNTLSSLSDGDNGGAAGRLALSLDPRPVRILGARLGSVRAGLTSRIEDDRFAPMDRLDGSFEGDRWNQGASTVGERRHEMTLQFDPVKALGVRGDVGIRSLAGGFRASRRAAALDLRTLFPGTLRWEEARNASPTGDGFRSRWSLDLAREHGRVLPRFSAGEERITGQDGDSASVRRSRLWTAGVGVRPSESLRLRSSYGVRRDEAVTAGALDVSDARTLDGGVTARAGDALGLDASFSRRRVARIAGDQAADLAQLVLTGGRPGGGLSSELRYDVTQLREPVVTRQLVAVASGAGSYDAYGNPLLGGGYEMVTATGDPSTRSRATVQLRIDAAPGRVQTYGGKRSAWRAFGGSTTLRLETLSTLPLGRVERAFRFGDYLDPASTLNGTMTARQSFDFAPIGSRFDAHAEAGVSRTVNGELAGLQSRGDGRDGRLRVRAPLPLRLRATATADLSRNTQTSERTDGAGDYSSIVRGRGYELEVARTLDRAWTVSLLGRHRRDADLTRGGYQDAWSVGPTARCATERLRFDARASYGRLDIHGPYAPAGRYLVAPLGRRIDYDLGSECRMGERLSLSLHVNGDQVERGPLTYVGRLELRSYF